VDASAGAQSILPDAEVVKLYNGVQGVTAPALLNVQPANPLESKCKGAEENGTVKFSFIVDTSGHPRNVIFEQALANDVDLLALKVMLLSRFQPAMLNGSPVAIGEEAEMHLKACSEEVKDQSGKVTSHRFRLRFLPQEKFEDWRDGPVEANLAPFSMPAGANADHERVDSHFSLAKMLVRPGHPSAGREGQFSFQVRLLIDEHGVPRDIEILKATDRTMLPQVVQSFRKLRYQPARKDGMPVPVHEEVGLDISSSPM
jgi:hypothetical protein